MFATVLFPLQLDQVVFDAFFQLVVLLDVALGEGQDAAAPAVEVFLVLEAQGDVVVGGPVDIVTDQVELLAAGLGHDL